MWFSLFLILFFFQCSKEHTLDEIYYCPMHPQVTSNKPGNCPICHMKLVKKQKLKQESSHENYENQKIQISKEKQTWIGVKTTKVNLRKIKKTLRFAGNIAYELEIFTALGEYAESLKQKEYSEFFHGESLSKIAYNRLLQLGLTKDGIQFLLPRRNQLLVGGKDSAIVVARIYEAEIRNILPKQPVKVFSPSYPNVTFEGKIQAFDGILDSETRTLRAWILVNNYQNFLKPQMLVEVELNFESKEVLTIPTTSIIHVGKKSIVYKQISETEFIAKEILTGVESENYTEVVQGLDVNDNIVTQGVFLIDSEAKIKHTNEVKND